ncbi:MAG: hypothetical protein ACFFDI_19875 [Promethearchaeota archaeon]
MRAIQENVEVVLAYCQICERTINIPIPANLSTMTSSTGGLSKFTYVHKATDGEPLHALVLLIDPNRIVRRAEIADMCIESSQCPADFETHAYCQKCEREVNIPVSISEFNKAVSEKGFYTQSFIHGNPSHALMILVDNQRNVRRAEITNLGFAAEPRPTPKPLIPKERITYTILEALRLPAFSTIFEGLFIFDRRARTAISFLNSEDYSVPEIADRMENEIETLAEQSKSLELYSFHLKGKEFTYVISPERSVSLIGINFDRAYSSWLLTLVNILAAEKESPNTLGIEIYLQLMERRSEPPALSILSDLMFSSLYSVRFTFKYEQIVDRVLKRLEEQFPNVGILFRPCALGQCPLLEAINTETGLDNFDEFISLIAFVERRKLF